MITRFILNTCVSAYLSFLVSLGLVLLFSRLKHARFKACLFFLPFLKVVWDLLTPHATQCLSTLNAPENSRTLMAYMGFPSCGIKLTYLESTYSIGDILYELCPVPALALAMLLMSISLTRLFRCFRKQKVSLKNVDSFYETEAPISCAVIGLFRPKIVFGSTYLRSLTPSEKKAVLKHEQSHVRWGDNFTLYFLSFFDALFWFLPFRKFLKKKLLLAQEIACDQAAHAPLAIATAMQKAAGTCSLLFSLSFASPIQKRASFLLQETTQTPLWKRGVYLTTFGVVLIFILMSQFLPF